MDHKEHHRLKHEKEREHEKKEHQKYEAEVEKTRLPVHLACLFVAGVGLHLPNQSVRPTPFSAYISLCRTRVYTRRIQMKSG